MKQKITLLIVLGLLCGCLCACGGETMTQADKYWTDAQSANSLEDYLADEGARLDWETVRVEAENGELSLQQQFRIVLLLCTYEYQCLSEAYDTELSYNRQSAEEDSLRMFLMDYPDSSAYANAYLKKVNTQKDEFWDAFVVVFDPCDYLEALIAAADELDEQTLFNLLEGLNENEMWGMKLKTALMKWIWAHPEETQDYIEALKEKGFYEDFGLYESKRVHLENYAALHKTDTTRKSLPAWTDLGRDDDGMLKIVLVVMGVFWCVWGTACFLGAVFWWDRYSQYPKLFPFAKLLPWHIDPYKWAYETYGDKAVRKSVLLQALLPVVAGIIIVVVVSKDNAERGRIEDYQQVQQGEHVSFAGGELTLEEAEMSESFTAMRFNMDENRYEEAEVKADMYEEDMLLLKTTLTNNSSDMLRIVQEDLKFYAKPAEEGNNINGQAVVDGYLYHSDAIELDVKESVPVWFWISLTEEEQKQPHAYVLEYGTTGCVIKLE